MILLQMIFFANYPQSFFQESAFHCTVLDTVSKVAWFINLTN